MESVNTNSKTEPTVETEIETEPGKEFEFVVEYDEEEVEKELKERENLLLKQRVQKLEQELIEMKIAMKQAIQVLNLDARHKNLGKVKGTDIYYVAIGRGYKVFGTDTKQNKELLKESNGSWNPTLKGWIFPKKALSDLKRLGIKEELSIV